MHALSISARWTGSNTNPNNNDGQGRAGTDRSNMVQLHEQNFPEGTTSSGTVGHWGNSYPAHLNDSTLLGFTRDLLQTLATLDNGEYCRVTLTSGNSGMGTLLLPLPCDHSQFNLVVRCRNWMMRAPISTLAFRRSLHLVLTTTCAPATTTSPIGARRAS